MIVATGIFALLLSISPQPGVVNGTYDHNLDGWTIAGDAAWIGTQNFPANSAGGALSVSTSGTASAEQCVDIGTSPANSDGNLLLDMEMRFDLLDQKDSCGADGEIHISVEAGNGTSCDGSDSTFQIKFQPVFVGYETVGNFWENELFMLPDSIHYIRIELSSVCRTHRGTLTAYFDNIRLRDDRMFSDDLEH